MVTYTCHKNKLIFNLTHFNLTSQVNYLVYFVDLFFYRDPEDAEKDEQARQENLAAQAAAAAPAKAAEENWGEEMTTDWANEPAPGAAVTQKVCCVLFSRYPIVVWLSFWFLAGWCQISGQRRLV